jgi:uncharacterized protein (TIGR03435 family)
MKIAPLLVLAGCVHAQSFEVASIRLHTDPITQVGVTNSGPRVRIFAMSVANLAGYAYDLKGYQISGGPGWATTDRYDINAKAEGEGTPDASQIRLMIQRLLTDRFQAKFHREMREIPVYVLVIGKNGPRFKESAPDAQQLLMMSGGQVTQVEVTKGGMEQLARQFSNSNGVARPVLNRTGLTGNYDYKLRWALNTGAALPDSPDAVSIFTALQEQLGLKLEPTKAAVEFLVIDSAEKPSEN